MTYGSGVQGQVGWAVESTAGTAVTVTKFVEATDVKFKHNRTRKTVEGIRAGGAAPLASKSVHTTVSAEGSLEVPCAYKGLGTLIKAAMGSAATQTLVLGSAYQAVHQPGDQQSAGSSLTIQVGKPRASGTVDPFTYRGSKCKSFEIKGTVDDFLMFKTEWDAWDEVTGTALATASYTTAGTAIAHGAQMLVKVGGTVTTGTGTMSVSGGTSLVGVKGFTIKGDNPLAAERFYANNAGVKAEQIVNGLRKYTIELDMDYIDRTVLYDLFVANTSTVLQITYEGAIISGSDKDTHDFILPAIKWDTAEVDLDKQDVLPQKLVGTMLDDGTNGFFQWRNKNADTTL